jgi:hypothetical protein
VLLLPDTVYDDKPINVETFRGMVLGDGVSVEVFDVGVK